MRTIYDAEYCSLHVRRGNRAAISLYKDVLGFRVVKIDDKYYADGEDALDMRVELNPDKKIKEVVPTGGAGAAATTGDDAKKEADALGDSTDTGSQQLAEANPDKKKKKKKNKK